ncbi:MAG: thiamine/thiamine pyrophosphate ABC transporter permease ThiP, partial [Pseudomonadota bacterium]
MAHSAVPVTARWPSAAAAALVLVLTLGTLGAVAWRAEWGGGLAPADWAAIRFTVIQSLLSALLSVLCAIPVARALARRRFRGRQLLITLLGAPFLLPVIVAVLGLLAIFGRGGLLNDGLVWLG